MQMFTQAIQLCDNDRIGQNDSLSIYVESRPHWLITSKQHCSTQIDQHKHTFSTIVKPKHLLLDHGKTRFYFHFWSCG
jgi:hypothetical protein